MTYDTTCRLGNAFVMSHSLLYYGHSPAAMLCCSVSAALLQMNSTMGPNCSNMQRGGICFAVDVEDHPVCRPAAGRPGRCGLVRQHQGHAAQLDWALTGQTAEEAEPAQLTSPPQCCTHFSSYLQLLVCDCAHVTVLVQLHPLCKSRVSMTVQH